VAAAALGTVCRCAGQLVLGEAAVEPSSRVVVVVGHVVAAAGCKSNAVAAAAAVVAALLSLVDHQ